MTWWGWILFWIAFWLLAFTYLGWRVWRLWPHARAFGRTFGDAFSRIEEARALADSRRPATSRGDAATANGVVSRHRSGELTLPADRSAVEDLAWNTPASEWRARRRAARARQRELRLDDHAEVWASWRDPLD